MPTFIDESGDTGHHQDSSRYFRLAAVWVPTLDIAEAFRGRVRELRRDLRLPQTYEFKFARTGSHHDRREAFLRAAMGFPFRFAVASLDKQHDDWRQAPAGAIHWACAVSLAATLRAVYCAAAPRPGAKELVMVDDNQDRGFLATVASKFRELRSPQGGKPLVGKVKFRGSGPDELIQLADMICGGIGAYLEGDSTWYQMIAPCDLGITRIP